MRPIAPCGGRFRGFAQCAPQARSGRAATLEQEDVVNLELSPTWLRLALDYLVSRIVIDGVKIMRIPHYFGEEGVRKFVCEALI